MSVAKLTFGVFLGLSIFTLVVRIIQTSDFSDPVGDSLKSFPERIE